MVAREPPLDHRRVQYPERGVMTKVDDILMFCCVSSFFAGIVIAVTTLPV
jgi:hypothetical protein